MIVHEDYISYMILGQKVNLISDKLEATRNTVAEINEVIYYLGHLMPDITTAIIAWEKMFEKTISDEDFKQVLIDNNLSSAAI